MRDEHVHVELARLRQDYPRWGFLVIRGMWVAVRGRHLMIKASCPRELRQVLPQQAPTVVAFALLPDSQAAPACDSRAAPGWVLGWLVAVLRAGRGTSRRSVQGSD